MWWIGLIALAAGVLGTGGGGLLAALLKDRAHVSISFLLGLAGGVMLTVVFYDMLPEALALGGFLYGILGLILGVFGMIFLDRFLPHLHPCEEDVQGRFLRSGMLLGCGMGLHNFPEGIAIGAGFAYSPALGYGLALVIGLHNLPEGMALGAPLTAAGISRKRVILFSALAGVPVGIGALFGNWVGTMSSAALALALSVAAGAMLYITSSELLPSARENSRGQEGSWGMLLGVIIGLSLSLLAH